VSTSIGIVIFEGAEELDWAGPWEVFKMARIGHPELRAVLIAQSARRAAREGCACFPIAASPMRRRSTSCWFRAVRGRASR
jgi:hypothetical protein